MKTMIRKASVKKSPRIYTQEHIDILRRFDANDHKFDLVHQEIKHRGQKMDLFMEQTNKRFEQVDKRFSSIQWFMGMGFTMLVVLMSVYKFVQ